MTESAVRAELDNGVMRLTLDRVDHMNALDLATAYDLLRSCEQLRTCGAGAVLLTAAGDHFCAGGDVRYFAQDDRPHDAEGVGALVSTLHAAIRILNAVEVPVVSAVQGWCVGAGLGLALVADIVLAAESARFRSAYTAIGFTPDLGASWHLPRLAGRVRAGTFILGNRPINAATAADWGLVGEVVPDAELQARATMLAQTLAAGARGSHRGVRALLRDDDREAFERRLDVEARSVTRAADSPEGRGGVAAFLAGRRPDFTGLDKPAGPGS